MRNDHVECEACAVGKKHRKEFTIHKEKRQREILELIHTDICGPMQTRSIGGSWYFLIFVDDRSRYTWVYFIRRKSDVFEYFKEFKNMVEKETSNYIKILRSDQGGEFMSNEFFNFFEQHGIKKQFYVAINHQQNGIVERMNKTVQ